MLGDASVVRANSVNEEEQAWLPSPSLHALGLGFVNYLPAWDAPLPTQPFSGVIGSEDELRARLFGDTNR
jgi:hypothetical protein